ncbi:MAG: hypothetical protein ACI9K2_007552 [Myxococcota bacterium]|jgi:hypothetical protein
MSSRTRAILATSNAVALGVALVCNGLANALPLNGMNTGELSDLYPNLFVPTGLTFSIWGLIYLWLLAFAAYGFSLIRSDRDSTPLERIGPWFAVNALANAAWIFAWHWQLVPLSLAIMGALLATLIVLYQRLEVGLAPASAADRWLVHAPVSVYLGWITVASIANVTTLAIDLGVSPFGSVAAALTVGVLATAVAIASRMLWARHDVLFALVVSWALVGITLKRVGAAEEGSAVVAGAAVVGLVVLGVGVVGTVVRTRRSS